MLIKVQRVLPHEVTSGSDNPIDGVEVGTLRRGICIGGQEGSKVYVPVSESDGNDVTEGYSVKTALGSLVGIAHGRTNNLQCPF